MRQFNVHLVNHSRFGFLLYTGEEMEERDEEEEEREREKSILIAMEKENKSKEVQCRRGSLVLPNIYDKGHLIKRDHSDSPMKSRKRKPRGAMIDCICKRRLGRRQRWSQRLKFVYHCCIPLLQEVLSNFVGLPF